MRGSGCATPTADRSGKSGHIVLLPFDVLTDQPVILIWLHYRCRAPSRRNVDLFHRKFTVAIRGIELYQPAEWLTLAGDSQISCEHDSRWQTEGRLPWARRLRCGRTLAPARSAGLPSGRRMPRRRGGCWRSRRCSTALRGKMRPRSAGWTVRRLRDWVIRFNEQGPDGLINIPSPGVPPKLGKKHRAFLARLVEEGPIPAVHGVVRWRACDLIMRLHEEFGLSVSDDTIYRALKDLGFSHVSARPKAYKQDPDAMEAFKKTLPTAWRKSAPNSHRAHR